MPKFVDDDLRPENAVAMLTLGINLTAQLHRRQCL